MNVSCTNKQKPYTARYYITNRIIGTNFPSRCVAPRAVRSAFARLVLPVLLFRFRMWLMFWFQSLTYYWLIILCSAVRCCSSISLSISISFFTPLCLTTNICRVHLCIAKPYLFWFSESCAFPFSNMDPSRLMPPSCFLTQAMDTDYDYYFGLL